VAGPYPWVTSSGALGLSEVNINLGPEAMSPRKYTVRLYFAEPEKLSSGQRLMDIDIQGHPVLREFDIFREASGGFRTVIKEFRGIEAAEALTIRLKPSPRARVRTTLLCGLELIAEDRKYERRGGSPPVMYRRAHAAPLKG